MNKRFKYFISSLFSAFGFFVYLSLPYESRYFGLVTGVVLLIFCFWFGLGIIFDGDIYTRLMSVLMPVCFFVGFGLFGVLLPYNLLIAIVLSIFVGIVLYTLFLVENVFLVAIGFKTVPLYRAAYTVSLIALLLSSFFLFNSLFSFKLIYWQNMIWIFIISAILFTYQFWAVAIELPDDGATKNIKAFIFIPALLMAEMGMVLSFWPTGIFKGSVYLVSAVYIISSLIQAEIRGRLFAKTVTMYLWVGAAVIVAMLAITRWG